MKRTKSIIILIFTILAITSCSNKININNYIDKNLPLIIKIGDPLSTADTIKVNSDKYLKLIEWGNEHQNDWYSAPASYISDIFVGQGEFRLLYTSGTEGVVIGFTDKKGNPKQFNRKIKKGELDFLKIEKKSIMEPNFPWSKATTQNAINAILKSIENINQNPKYTGNFPTDINNMPFVRKTKADFEIVGYSFSETDKDIYTIDYQPKNEYDSGPRFTVEINIKTNKAIRVYMTPDS